MKYTFTCLALLLTLNGFAQEQYAFFVKNNGALVKTKDSADFVRVVSEPETGSDLFTVSEYYTSGKKKQLYKSSVVYPIRVEGTLLSFYENGKRKSIENYKGGVNVNNTYQYYPNGRIYLVKKHVEAAAQTSAQKNKLPAYHIAEAYDSLGTATVVEGNGPFTIYTDDFTGIAEQGVVKDGKRNGVWKGGDKATNSTFEEEYMDGVLKVGKASYNGAVVNYSQRSTPAQFSGGDAAFGMYLARRVKYPADARENGTQGKVIVSFDVEKDGRLSNFQVVGSVSNSLDDAAVNVLKGSPKWQPSTLYGQPIKANYTVSIAFSRP